MGLDVYLFKSDDIALLHKKEQELEEFQDQSYKYAAEQLGLDKEEMERDWRRTVGPLQEKYFEIAREWRKENITDEFEFESEGSDWIQLKGKYKEEIQFESRVHPEHYFKLGYFRSSYNNSGINSVLRNSLGKDGLYYIFNKNCDEYDFQPDWMLAKKRCEEIISLLSTEKESTGGRDVRVKEVSVPLFGHPDEFPSNQHEALEIYKKRIKDGYKSWYSNKDGSFFFNDGVAEGEEEVESPLKVRAIINGFTVDSLHNKLAGKEGYMPVFYIIHEIEDCDYYKQALEIVMETIQYVLDTNEPEKYYFSWSA